MRKKYKLGDVVRIQLNKIRFTYGQILNDASIRIFNITSKSEIDVYKLKDIGTVFYSGIFDTSIVSGKWPVVGNIPFEKEDDSWAPAEYIQDVIKPETYRIYYKGEIKSATKEDTLHLEKSVMRKPDELINVLNSLFK